MSTKYQTLSEFMRRPFGNSNSTNMEKAYKYSQRYAEYIQQNKIRVEGYTQVEDSYYIHIKVPSESKNKDGINYEYDVVIRFFTDNPNVKKQLSLRAYYIQFFSNSPGFIYRYAALYKKYGYLIDILYNKLDPEFKDVLPEKTNANMELSFDNTIYFACRFLSDKNFALLNKKGTTITLKTVNQTKFFNDISDFKSVRLDQAIIQEDRKLKSIRKNKSPRKYSDTPNGKKSATNTTIKQGDNRGITVAKKITGKKKITAKKSTRKM